MKSDGSTDCFVAINPLSDVHGSIAIQYKQHLSNASAMCIKIAAIARYVLALAWQVFFVSVLCVPLISPAVFRSVSRKWKIDAR